MDAPYLMQKEYWLIFRSQLQQKVHYDLPIALY